MEPDTISWTNTRKRPFHQNLTTPNTSVARLARFADDDDEPTSSAKRNRTSDWPLKNTVEASGAVSLNSQIKNRAPRQKRQPGSSTRPSKFREGSLNDRPSQEPPNSYIGDENALEQWYESRDRDSANMDLDFNAGIESAKPSGMFRFGKALASALNPVSVWQGINGIWKEKDQRGSTEEAILQARRAKAESTYAEMKKDGFKGTQPAATMRDSGHSTAVKCLETCVSRRNSFRDSAIDVDECPPSKPSDESQVAHEGLRPPPIQIRTRSASPFSGVNTRRKSSLHLRTPSFQSLKKVKSQIQLPSSKRQPIEVPPLPSTEVSESSKQAPAQGLPRQPSKKDLARQYRLSKRVSDLETKLDSARRQLEKSIHEAPPVPELPARIGRKPFKPGGLASLPSERILMSPSKNADMQNPISKRSNATSYVPKEAPGDSESQWHVRNMNSWLEVEGEAPSTEQPFSQAKVGKLPIRKGDERKPSTLEDDGKATSQEATSKIRSTRRRQSQQFGDPNPPSPSRITNVKPKVPPKPPTNSPFKSAEDVPPLPPIRNIFDPAKVNKAKIASMRTLHNRNVPFGKSPDDLVNLRKEYPSATEAQLTNYLASVRDAYTTKKITDHTSVLHHNRSDSPLLGRPSTITPRQTRSQTRKRDVSLPPPRVASTRKVRVARGGDVEVGGGEEKVADVGEEMSTEKPAAKAEKRNPAAEKPMLEAPKEEFEWPDDVF